MARTGPGKKEIIASQKQKVRESSRELRLCAISPEKEQGEKNKPKPHKPSSSLVSGNVTTLSLMYN